MSKPSSFRFSAETKDMLVAICEHDRRSQVGEIEHLISERYREVIKTKSKQVQSSEEQPLQTPS